MPTPYALKSQKNFVSFMYFLLNSTTDKRIPFALKSQRNCSQSSWPHENLKQSRERNITVLFTHCIKKKGRLEEAVNKENRTVWVSNFVQPNLHKCVFEFAVKLRIANFIDKKIVLQCLTCSRNFFVIEKQSSEEEMQPMKIFFVCVFCVLDMQGIWKFRSAGP